MALFSEEELHLKDLLPVGGGASNHLESFYILLPCGKTSWEFFM